MYLKEMESGLTLWKGLIWPPILYQSRPTGRERQQIVEENDYAAIIVQTLYGEDFEEEDIQNHGQRAEM